MRKIAEEELFHNSLGESFATHLSEYDTQRRVDVLVRQFLGRQRLSGSAALDVGCGLGYFSEAMQNLGADVTSVDLGSDMVRLTAERVGCKALVADALNLTSVFNEGSFDVVLSSECIEHTPDPLKAVEQMSKVLAPGGWLALSTPNKVWEPVVKLASALKLRGFHGLENFPTWHSLTSAFRSNGLEVVASQGLHLIPFQLRLHGLSTWMDRHAQACRGMMINICLLGHKPKRGPETKD